MAMITTLPMLFRPIIPNITAEQAKAQKVMIFATPILFAAKPGRSRPKKEEAFRIVNE